MTAGWERQAELLGDPETWALIAFANGQPIGHVGFLPARERSPGEPVSAWLERPVIQGLAHLWQLFVVPEWWGRGVAPLLHDAAIAEMHRQRYRGARLFTPTLQARARRFYERRGWSARAESWNDHFSLMMTEYRRPLD
jgi:GNAT superfamily N-acetyltransferase